jgi:hypothetical protein
MAKKHGARQQKRIAKQKAKRQAKRSFLARRTSSDPTVRLQQAGKWPVYRSIVSTELWDEGIGYAVIAREDPDGQIVFASFVLDVLCLGVKDAFWRPVSGEELKDLIEHMEEVERMSDIDPACLVKIITGAVEFAQRYGFPPHPDYRHVAMLLQGIDPSTCRTRFTFGDDGKPFYIQGPDETPAQAMAIRERLAAVGGKFLTEMPGDADEPGDDEDDDDELE